jgi:hypothetical protein
VSGSGCSQQVNPCSRLYHHLQCDTITSATLSETQPGLHARLHMLYSDGRTTPTDGTFHRPWEYSAGLTNDSKGLGIFARGAQNVRNTRDPVPCWTTTGRHRLYVDLHFADARKRICLGGLQQGQDRHPGPCRYIWSRAPGLLRQVSLVGLNIPVPA